MGDAAILQSDGTTTFYLLTGTPGTPSTYAWSETNFGAGTLVTVGGAAQSQWNADNKLDKITTSNTKPRIYAINTNGSQTTYKLSEYADSGTVVLRMPGGTVVVPLVPAQNSSATSKQYVDNGLAAKQDTLTAGNGITISGNVISASGGGGGGSSWNVIDGGANTQIASYAFSVNKVYEIIALAYHPMGDFPPISTPAFILDTSTSNMASDVFVSPVFDGAGVVQQACKVSPDLGQWSPVYFEWYDTSQNTPSGYKIKVYYREIA